MTEEAFVWAVQTHRDLLFRVAYTVLHNPEDCADALQDALENAWRKRHTLRDPQAFRAWMVRIVLNASKSMLRKRRFRFAPLDETIPAPEAEDTALGEMLAALEEGVRVPLVLHYMENMSIAEIAAVMHLTQSAVKSRLYAGRKRLAQQWKEEEETT